MKKLLLVSAILFLAFSVKAQIKDSIANNPADTSKRFYPVEVAPDFPGGIGKLFLYLGKNSRYKGDDKGKVMVTFVVEKDGSLSNVKIAKSLSPKTDAEAVRLINNSPKWIPGMQNGRPVRVQYTLPIQFNIDN